MKLDETQRAEMNKEVSVATWQTEVRDERPLRTTNATALMKLCLTPTNTRRNGTQTHLLVFSSLSHTHKFTLILISNTGILAGENLNKCTHSTQENKSVLRLFIMLIKFTHWNVNRFQRPRVHCGPYLHIMNNACCSSPVLLQRLLRTLFVVSEGNHDTWH